MSAANELRGQEAWSLALMRAQGREAEARHYLEQINRVQRAFGFPDFSMPEPLMTGEPDFISCPAVSYPRIGLDVDPQTGNSRIAA